MQLPTEIYDLIADHVENAEYPYITDEGFSAENRARRQLARLRLVNRAYCRSTSRHLFRHITIRLYGRPSTIMAIPPLVRLMEISKSPLAHHVRQLEIGFEGIPKRAEDRPDLEDFAGMLSPCLARFSNLKELSFGGPRPSPYLSQEETRSYINSVVKALRYVPLPNIEGLELHFPLCHDFGLFFPPKRSAVHVPIASILRPLRRLELEVCAYTDSRHQRFPYRGTILPEYAALPNETYVSSLYQMLEPAINLTSLSIDSHDILDLDPVNFSSSIKLRSLILMGVSISAHNLLSLIMNQSRETLQFMYLRLVKLNSETWHHVLSEMTKISPHLTEFYMESAGYSPLGSSAHLVTAIPSDPDHEPPIETYSRDDLFALGALQRVVNANRVRAGLRPFSKYEYQYAESVPPIDHFRESYFGI